MDDANANAHVPNDPGGQHLSEQFTRIPTRQIERFSRTERVRQWIATLTPIITAVSTAIAAILPR